LRVVFIGSLHAAAAPMFFHKFQHCFTSSFFAEAARRLWHARHLSSRIAS
jgi:hypothetical protein